MSDNEEHPAHEAIVDILYNIRTAIKGAASLPSYMDGALISIPMSKEQTIAYEAQIRSLRGVENMIIERYPGAIN
jgi:hypothetical protein